MIVGSIGFVDALRELSADAAAPLAGGGWKPALALSLFVLVLGSAGRLLLDRRLSPYVSRTRNRVDDVLVALLRRFWTPAVVLLALAAAARLSPLPQDSRSLLTRLFLSGFLGVIVLGAARLAECWIGLRADAAPAARPTLLQSSARAAILVAGSLLVLDNAGLEITPLLAALGIGSLAVGLALQPTLSNFFAGIHLSMAKPIRVGDFVELEDGSQGHVVDIGWRATRLRQLANNLLVVPNSRLAEMRLLNYSLPESAQAVVVSVGVGYGSDLERVERITVEVAREIQRSVPEADSEHEPFARFGELGDSAVGMSVILRARLFTGRWTLVHEFLKRLHSRFAEDGIEIPFPQRVVTLKEPT